MPEQMKILIAYDGSSGADAALEDLPRAGLPRVAEALIMSVAEVFLPPSSLVPTVLDQVPEAVQRAWAQAARAMEEAHALACQARTRVLTAFPAWDVRTEACADSPAWAVIKKAESWQPDLIVVGSHGRSALGRFLLGSVSQKILTEAHCSVRIGRRPLQPDTAPLRLLVGIDGTCDAEAAAHAVAARAWPAGSSMRLVTALDARMSTALAFMHVPGERSTEAGDDDERGWMSKIMEDIAAPLRTQGLTISSVMKEGDPKHVLLDEAEQWGADCLFVGAHGLSHVERFLLGSVSAAVAARAQCAVEVVRPHASCVGVSKKED